MAALGALVMARSAEAGTSYTLAMGPVHANDLERDEAYFNIGHGKEALMIAPHPESMAAVRMKELVGKSIRLQAVPE